MSVEAPKEPDHLGAAGRGGVRAVPRFLRGLGVWGGRWLAPLWGDSRLAIAVGMGSAAAWGALAGWWMPRGPMTAAQALWSMVLSLAVGFAAGLVMRSRWAMLVAPVTFAGVFEIVRIGTDGPLVDGLVSSTYGVLALVVGRGFHSLLSLVPMLLGAAVGAGTARLIRRPENHAASGHRVGAILRRSVAVLAAVALVALGLMISRPAHTSAIRDADGNEVPGSVAELTRVDVGDRDLAAMIRGHSSENPVLLFLAGGPGGSELGAMRNHLPALEEHFTVVTWDQRGTGKSYPELEPTATLTLDAAVADTLAVTDYLRDRFDVDQIYLVGQSWGSTLGVLAVQAAPEKYAAFVGVGQMVSQLATDRIYYEDTLAWANESGRNALADDLIAAGPPPYTSVLDYETALSYEHEIYPYDHTGNSEGEGGFSENFMVDEYTLLEKVHLLAGFMDTFTVLYPQLQDIDFRRTATSFDVPVFFVQGVHEADGRAEVFEDWYPMVEAPAKDVTYLATSGHRPMFEQPDEFVAYMVDTVLARTAAR